MQAQPSFVYTHSRRRKGKTIMQYELNTDGDMHRITVPDLEEEDQPEFVELDKMACYEPDNSDIVYIAFSEDSNDELYTDTSLRDGVVYRVEKCVS